MSRLRDLETLYPAGPTRFADRVAAVVRAIPRGKTLSYSGVANLAGRPGGARAVTRALQATKGLPWWRVIRSDKTLAYEVADEQARRLRAEGVKIVGRRVLGKEPKPRKSKPRGKK
jgi:methylated-DNA-protein-cysteine methyltransferase related protein